MVSKAVGKESKGIGTTTSREVRKVGEVAKGHIRETDLIFFIRGTSPNSPTACMQDLPELVRHILCKFSGIHPRT